MRAYWALVVVLAACGNPAATGDDAMTDGGSGDGSMGDAGDGWTTLIERSWTQIAASESFQCRQIRIPQDMYISGFRAVTPTGTHHEIVSITTGSTLVGDYPCTPTALSNNPGMLYAAGIGSTDSNFPPGVALKVPAGTYVQLYIHVFNASDASLTQTSGVQVKLANPADVLHEADMMFGGRRSFTIPYTDPPTPYHVLADCGAPEDWHIVGLWPHMHDLGVHQNVAVRRASVVINTLLDTDYSYLDEKSYAMDVTVTASDRVGFDCTFLNTTGNPVGASDGQNGEMCFTGFYKWPAGGDPYYCVNP